MNPEMRPADVKLNRALIDLARLRLPLHYMACIQAMYPQADTWVGMDLLWYANGGGLAPAARLERLGQHKREQRTEQFARTPKVYTTPDKSLVDFLKEHDEKGIIVDERTANAWLTQLGVDKIVAAMAAADKRRWLGVLRGVQRRSRLSCLTREQLETVRQIASAELTAPDQGWRGIDLANTSRTTRNTASTMCRHGELIEIREMERRAYLTPEGLNHIALAIARDA